MRGELVDLSGSGRRQSAARDDPVALELAEPEAQNIGGNAREALAEIREPFGPERELADDEERPALPDQIERAGDPAVLVVGSLRQHFVKKTSQLLFASIVTTLADVTEARRGRT
jgi:hypothetical protein